MGRIIVTIREFDEKILIIYNILKYVNGIHEESIQLILILAKSNIIQIVCSNDFCTFLYSSRKADAKMNILLPWGTNNQTESYVRTRRY